MRKRVPRESMADELQLAIGLVWGHLNAYQYQEAHQLATGCLQLWPDEPRLFMMAAFAAAELLEPVDQQRLLALRTPQNQAWIALVLRRLEWHDAAAPPEAATLASAARGVPA